jgi:hypothetical protein
MLSAAYQVATASEDTRTGLNGPIRDMIFGLNTSVETLAQMIEETFDHS